MAASVATSQPAAMGLNPLQSQGLAAAASQQHHLQQQPQQSEFDLRARKLTLNDFQRVRTLGTGMALQLSQDIGITGHSD